MNEKSIRDRLVEHGEILFQAPKQLVQFTKVLEADALLNDLERHPHAFLLACVMDPRSKPKRRGSFRTAFLKNFTGSQWTGSALSRGLM